MNCWHLRNIYSPDPMAALTPHQIASALVQADAAFDAGQFTRTDYCARSVLESDSQNGPAFNLLGILAATLGLIDHAQRYFQASVDCGFGEARGNLQQLQGMPRPALPAQERYLLIKAWGFGFWSDIAHVLGGLLLAEMTGRTPIVHWGANSRFGDGTAKEVFSRYFQPISALTLEHLPVSDADFFPSKWSPANLRAEDHVKWDGDGARVPALFFLGRPERIAVADFYMNVADLVPWIAPDHPWHALSAERIYRALVDKYLKPQPRIAAAVESFAAQHFGSAPILAVHLRGSDKRAEMAELDTLNATYFDAIAKENPEARIFLLTDDERWLARFQLKYGDRLIVTESLRAQSEQGIHYTRLDAGARLGDEVMIDAYLATRAQAFIGNGRSNVSAMIAVLKAWPEGTSTLLAPSQLFERNGA